MHKIPSDLEKIINNLSKEEFVFDFLIAYNTPNSTIARLKKGELNKLEEKWELLLRKKVFFKNTNTDLFKTIDNIKNDLKNNKSKPRFVIVTNFEKFLAFDTKVNVWLDIDFNQLHKHHDFFLPLVWIEKQEYQNENIADVKAANNLAKLFDEIVKDNAHDTSEQRHALNIFLSRLLFCYFAEDTNIFTVNKFTSSLWSHTKLDWSDTHVYLEKLFEVFNTKDRDDSLPEYFDSFPYVNGKLFQDIYEIPKFTTKSRKLLIELWELDWSWINPDIFGSMMQAVMDSDERWNMWSHYTSVPNIMKVINPLFLDELNEEFEENIWSPKKLNALLERISKIKFFDPACWSGNFLIIAYKEIRRLEIEILKEIWVWALTRSIIELKNFYWIELNDFAHETAKLSLYLAEHQMNVEFYNETWISVVSLPLKLWGNIVCWNATRVDWEEVCPKEEWDEIYLLWNPPYLWARYQEESHRKDNEYVLKEIKWYKRLDYIASWFYKSAKYIKWINSKSAFVTTNSINQWEQVINLWPEIFSLGLEIDFAYTSFKWQNNAKGNAAVIVAIIWLRNKSKKEKYLFNNHHKIIANNINWYLLNWENLFIQKRSNPLSNIPKITRTNPALDDWYLLLNDDEKNNLIFKYPDSKKIIKPVVWALEFLKWVNKWCLWISNDDLEYAKSIPEINERIEKVRIYRLKRDHKWENNPVNKPHQFLKMKMAKEKVLFIPTVSSERREYLPCWLLEKNTVIIDPNFAIYDPEDYILWIFSSKIHVLWMKIVSWKLKSDYRYSSTLCYNNFPFPYITKKQKEEIEEHVYNILDEREKHSEKTLAEMYDPDKMPEWLKQAHHELDLAIERCYRPKAFESDEERLEYLFKMYEKMIAKENEK